MLEPALDFFNLHRSHALHTLFRALLSLSDEGLVAWAVILRNLQPKVTLGDPEGLVGWDGINQVEGELFMLR